MSAPVNRYAVCLASVIATAVSSCAAPPREGASPPLPEALASLPAERLVDLSHPFDEETVFWPTARPFTLAIDAEGMTEGGYWYASNSLSMSEHGGTHLDAPYHFARDGWTADRIPLGALLARAVVIDVRKACAHDPDHATTKEEILGFEAVHGPIPAGAVAILWTGWGARWPDRKRYLGDDTPGDASNLHFPGVSPEAARYLAETRRVAGVGIDTASIDPGRSKDFLAHRVLAAANIYNLENLRGVGRLPPAGATVIALPMKIAGGTGGPARVVAILP
ncbi:MAG: cyclase family protein [Acidobacteriota bacterium]